MDAFFIALFIMTETNLICSRKKNDPLAFHLSPVIWPCVPSTYLYEDDMMLYGRTGRDMHYSKHIHHTVTATASYGKHLFIYFSVVIFSPTFFLCRCVPAEILVYAAGPGRLADRSHVITNGVGELSCGNLLHWSGPGSQLFVVDWVPIIMRSLWPHTGKLILGYLNIEDREGG